MVQNSVQNFNGILKKKDFEHGTLKNITNDNEPKEPLLLSQKHPVPLQVYYNRHSKKGKKSTSTKGKKVKQLWGIKHRMYYTGEHVLSFFHYDWAEMFRRLGHNKCELFKEIGVLTFKYPRVQLLPTIFEQWEEYFYDFE
uniref:IENR2 domain-containing protein n=1 Tax=Strongyloides stercoralis TaxID=6248 RepID=A0A0K0EB32_STRER